MYRLIHYKTQYYLCEYSKPGSIAERYAYENATIYDVTHAQRRLVKLRLWRHSTYITIDDTRYKIWDTVKFQSLLHALLCHFKSVYRDFDSAAFEPIIWRYSRTLLLLLQVLDCDCAARIVIAILQ